MMNTSQQVLTMEKEQDQQYTVHNREGFCPTCGQYTAFHFLGEQRWPARLVEATGCPPVTYLFTCASCQTTVSEEDIGS
jgi:hypothetical protein